MNCFVLYLELVRVIRLRPLPKASVTHAISCFKRFQRSLASFRHVFFNTVFSEESGCKDTTIFQTTKYFFRFFCIFFPNHPIVNSFQNKLFFMRPILRFAKRLFPLVYSSIFVTNGPSRLLITM